MLWAFLGTLAVAPVCAEEGSNTGLLTTIASTTLSGYADTTIVWRLQSQYPHGLRGWARTFFLWFRFRAWS
ncbi:MAG: hypothetical protein DME18_12615 [Verrucomicrobia bacterium]|nr:MAG: hypothetical protein DME18_12615 [Verrucomicrobiota bacterium]